MGRQCLNSELTEIYDQHNMFYPHSEALHCAVKVVSLLKIEI